jgi:hypothetical protein
VVNGGTEPKHGNNAGENDENIIHRISIRYQGQLDFDELKELKEHEDCIEKIQSQESRGINEDSVHILSAQVHQAYPKQEPRV